MMSEAQFRQLPSVDRLLSDKCVSRLCETFPREVVVDLIRRYLAEIRCSTSSGDSVPSFVEVVNSIVTRAHDLEKPSLQPVINATGVILHTNLGRAPLSPEVIKAIELTSRGYCNLELDLDSGKRGSRRIHVEHLLCQLTSAEAALVVNNNAAGILLALSALAKRKEVIISRGQGVQIGGGFRIPEVMRQSGAKLVEVGTTNCTYLEDYEQAITPRTAALLRVHSSNFRILGFTHSVPLKELVELGNQHNLPVLDDLGSGSLIDTTRFGLDHEPMVQESLTAGATLVFFSGDKLLGGPQAGIILGQRAFVEKLQRHPLARAVRIDKGRLAGLTTTLFHYLRGDAIGKIPVLRLIATPLSELEKRAERWVQMLGNSATVVTGESTVGGGSLPGSVLPTRLVAIRLGSETKVKAMARRLRQHQPPIISRVTRNTLLLDLHCVFPEEDKVVIEAVREAIDAFDYS